MSFELTKWIWTEEDLNNLTFNDSNQLGFHNCKIYGVSMQPEKSELAFDIDYVFKWRGPETQGVFYELYVAPATLVFEAVTEFRMDFFSFEDIQMDKIFRDKMHISDEQTNDARAEGRWVISCENGDIPLWAKGFKLYIRRTPVRTEEFSLGLETRGGSCFARG